MLPISLREIGSTLHTKSFANDGIGLAPLSKGARGSKTIIRPMVIGACQVQLHLPGCGSLKEKRGLIKPLVARLHREFNVAAAEVEHQDVWQMAGLAIVAVGNDAAHLEAELQQIVRWIEHNRPEVEVEDAAFELR